MPDKFAATWVSHSSIGDFLKCPRAYYLNNVYKDAKTNHKIAIINPSLALGQAVHEVVESLSQLPTDQRFATPLTDKFYNSWSKIAGKKGGFANLSQEEEYKQLGLNMIKRVMDNPGPLSNLAVKIKMDLPHYWLSPDDEIILCGKIDWLEYLPESDSVHIIDFKTGKHEEKDTSLQLPIYRLLVHNCQHRKTEKASYWYLQQSESLTPKDLPDLEFSRELILNVAKKIKLARKLSHFNCPQGDGGCFHCRPFEQIISGLAEYVGTNDFKQDLYVISSNTSTPENIESMSDLF